MTSYCSLCRYSDDPNKGSKANHVFKPLKDKRNEDGEIQNRTLHDMVTCRVCGDHKDYHHKEND